MVGEEGKMEHKAWSDQVEEKGDFLFGLKLTFLAMVAEEKILSYFFALIRWNTLLLTLFHDWKKDTS